MDLAKDLEPDVPQEEIQAAEQEQEKLEQQEQPEKQEQPEQPPEAEKKAELERNYQAAMKEERRKRQELERRYEQERIERERTNAVLQDRLQQLFGQQQNQPQFRDPETDPDGPVAAIKHNQMLQNRALEQIAQERAVQHAEQRQIEQTQQLIGWARAQRAEFEREAPDFADAYQHVLRMRAGELHAMGLSQDEIRATIEQDELWVYRNAAQKGVNPAQMVYNMAKNTGYTGKKPAQQPAAEAKVDALNKGQAAAKDLGGGANPGIPTPEQIANMSDDEFDELKAKLKKQGKRLSDYVK